MKHKINLTFDCVTLHRISVSRVIKKCIDVSLQMQGVDIPCEVNVLVTDDKGIHTI